MVQIKGRKLTIIERLIKIETLLENHLKHHEHFEWFFLLPLFVGLLLLIAKVYFLG